MSTFRLNLELPGEPEPAVLLHVMKLLGVLAETSGGEGKTVTPAGENSLPVCPQSKDDPLLLGRDEAAAKLNISTTTLDRWRKAGLVPVVKLPGAAPMFSAKELRKFVAANSRINSPPPRREVRPSDRIG